MRNLTNSFTLDKANKLVCTLSIGAAGDFPTNIDILVTAAIFYEVVTKIMMARMRDFVKAMQFINQSAIIGEIDRDKIIEARV